MSGASHGIAAITAAAQIQAIIDRLGVELVTAGVHVYAKCQHVEIEIVPTHLRQTDDSKVVP